MILALAEVERSIRSVVGGSRGRKTDAVAGDEKSGCDVGRRRTVVSGGHCWVVNYFGKCIER